MKQFLFRNRQSMLFQAFRSGSILSLFVYTIIRILAFDFPMSWGEEILLFIKIMAASCFLIASATLGSAWVYKNVLNLKRRIG
jgi:hypothetical protein